MLESSLSAQAHLCHWAGGRSDPPTGSSQESVIPLRRPPDSLMMNPHTLKLLRYMFLLVRCRTGFELLSLGYTSVCISACFCSYFLRDCDWQRLCHRLHIEEPI